MVIPLRHELNDSNAFYLIVNSWSCFQNWLDVSFCFSFFTRVYCVLFSGKHVDMH